MCNCDSRKTHKCFYNDGEVYDHCFTCARVSLQMDDCVKVERLALQPRVFQKRGFGAIGVEIKNHCTEGWVVELDGVSPLTEGKVLIQTSADVVIDALRTLKKEYL